jgi:transposase
MSQRTKILTDILGYRGWRIRETYFEWANGQRCTVLPRGVRVEVRIVVVLDRRWAARCGACGAICRRKHESLPLRRWQDLSWAGRPVQIECAAIRVECERCQGRPVEMLAWAEPYQRQTRRLQQHLALEAASMPVMHVAVLNGLSWGTVRRAEGAALARWDATRTEPLLTQVGIDEKWLGRRHHLEHNFVTVVSNLQTGEPLWIGPGRSEATVASWLATLTDEEKARLTLVAMDMHRAFWNAIKADEKLAHVAVVHDPFHVMKRACEAVNEVRKDIFFRAGPEQRRVGRGTRWLVLRAWEHCNAAQIEALDQLLAMNLQLARAYQIVEELRSALRAPDRKSMEEGLQRVLRRTQLRRHKHLRKLHESLVEHQEEILALGEFHPPTGRIEALNNNWETLVRRARGYRDYQYLLLKLRFMTANPVRSVSGTERFLALGLPEPKLAHAA